MARRTRNRLELRAEFDAAERRKEEEDKVKGEDAEDEEEDDEEEEDDDEAEAGDEAEDEELAEEEDEDEPKPKKKKKPAKEPKPRKARVAKVVRQKAVWAVFNNSNQRVATFDYPKKQEALDHAVKLKGESKTNQTYFVQMVKEPLE
jgi:hypothetical protein